MTDDRYRRNAGCVFSLKYHLVWCPKYRKPVLTGRVAGDLRKLLRQKADELGVTIEALEIMPDHVHQFKGFTSRVLRQKHAPLRSSLPTLWSRSYYVGSVGQVSDETVKGYIEMQKGRE